MAIDGDGEPELLDLLMANGWMLEVFMAETAVTLARQQPDPREWARLFVERLQLRIDQLDQRMQDQRYPTHELARMGFDRLGQHLAVRLAPPAPRE